MDSYNAWRDCRVLVNEEVPGCEIYPPPFVFFFFLIITLQFSAGAEADSYTVNEYNVELNRNDAKYICREMGVLSCGDSV